MKRLQNTIFRTSFLTILNYDLISQMANEVSRIAQSDRISGACFRFMTTYRKLIIRTYINLSIDQSYAKWSMSKENAISLQREDDKLDDIIQKLDLDHSAPMPTPSCQSNDSIVVWQSFITIAVGFPKYFQ